MPRILSTLACNLDANILAASLPLMEESRVEAIEWSFDTLYKVKEVPAWFRELLNVFSNEKRLIGHGVFFSLFSGKWLPEQVVWLKHLRQTCTEFRFDHITEHFGFMTGKDFHRGAPLNIPYTSTTLNIGRDRLKRIQEACRLPVGLENLAFSYSLDEAKRHGAFLEQLLEPVNGFIILDLHNLYCQLRNFDLAFDELISLYPLERVREIHISGGSWDASAVTPSRSIRRDTHDDSVPRDVFQLLEMSIARCPNLKYVVLEQLGDGLATAQSRSLFYNDFLQMAEIVRRNNDEEDDGPKEPFLPSSSFLTGAVVEDSMLYEQQLELSSILESSNTYEEAMLLLKQSSLAKSDWRIEQWEPYMIETAVKIAQKWK
ncbi:DUF692 family multinuclear iron-containing protein [uncultured Chitinophaga sp.]|uniref:multinuclear nonheme iron-dependent oxidase n=1 Tax=uncultured Chitinophaga sp. TaxID=339340 RepID=UPI0026145C48|nr:DUF692 family multinuclear iron-containing protein [uncultured Chitinophaga sp.]